MPIFKAFSKLKQFDAYPKTIEDFRIKTLGGATGERYIKIHSFTGYLKMYINGCVYVYIYSYCY